MNMYVLGQGILVFRCFSGISQLCRICRSNSVYLLPNGRKNSAASKKFGKKKSLPHSFCRERGRDEIRLFATVESLAQIALCKFGKLLCGEVFLVRQSVSLPLYAFFEHVAHISGISEVAVLMAHHAVEPVF